MFSRPDISTLMRWTDRASEARSWGDWLCNTAYNDTHLTKRPLWQSPKSNNKGAGMAVSAKWGDVGQRARAAISQGLHLPFKRVNIIFRWAEILDDISAF
ncbi:hypothetical protein MTO96_009783 [Rhipicephalus appendiculatus]